MTIFSRSLIVLALTGSVSAAMATPSFDSLTIRSTEISAKNESPRQLISVDPNTGERTDTQFNDSDVRGWEVDYSEQLNDNTYWFAGYRNDRQSLTEHSQIYQPSPITISNYFNQTNITTRQYTLGAGYIFELSEHTTFDINGSIGRMKLKVDDFHQMDSEQTTTTFLLRSHHYSTVAGYNARLRHEFTEDLEFYTSIGGERWYADEDDTISVQTIGLNYFIFDETAISVEYGKYDGEERSAVGVHFTF